MDATVAYKLSTCTYSDLLAMRVQSEVGGSGGSGTERPNVKAQEVPAPRTVLAISLEEREGDNTKTPPKLLLVMLVPPMGNVLEMNTSIAKDEDNATKRPGQPLQLAYEGNNDCKKGSPGLTAQSMKVAETTLMDGLVTHKQLVSQRVTDMKDLKTNDFRDSPTKTPEITVPWPPFTHMGS